MELARRVFVLWIIAALPSLAQQAMQRGDFDLAIDCLDTYRYFNPDDARIHGLLGWAYFKQGDSESAIAAYSKAIDLDPNSPAGYMGRGAAHGAAGELDEAIDDLTKALEIDPDAAGAYHDRGLAYTQKRAYERALADFEQVIHRAPEAADTLRQRGFVHHEMKHYRRALADYEAVLRLDASTVSVRLAAVELLTICPDERVRNLARAGKLARELEPDALGARRALATLAAAHAQRGDLAQAIRWQRKALACAEHLDREERRRTALVLKLYRSRKKQEDRSVSRRTHSNGRAPRVGRP